MSLTKDDILEILGKAKELGLNSFEADGVKFAFGQAAAQSVAAIMPVLEQKAEELISPLSPFEEMSSEEILYYSTPFYDELQQRKLEHEEKLKAEGKIQ